MPSRSGSSASLPPWRMADLPAPPRFTFRSALAVIGPGTIALSMSIGGGEWLLGPATVVKYGFSMMGIVTLSILLQLVMNLQFVRYTLYTGEPIVNGFLRTPPGPWFWAAVYLALAVCQGAWPAWAANSASTLFAAWSQRLPGTLPEVDDRQIMLLLGCGSFCLCVLIVAFGGKVERMLEIVNEFMVVFIVGFLLAVDLLFVPGEVWWKGLTGHLHLGWLPRSGAGIDWILLGALAAYAGAGGVSNLWILFGTQLAFTDGIVRLATDVLWTASPAIRRRAKDDIRRVYYLLRVLYAVWGCAAMQLSQPVMLLKISANVAGVVLIVAGLHVLWLNGRLLPREVRGPAWQRAAVGGGVLFYAFFAAMNLVQLVRS
jgi:Mn2+/Fe2+ NRAMP family transporter